MNQYFMECQGFGDERLMHVQMFHHPSKMAIAGFVAKPGTDRYDKGTALYTMLIYMFEQTDINAGVAAELMNHFHF